MSTQPSQGAVVVGLDGSQQSLLALDWAIDAALAEGRPLHLLHAHGRRGANEEGARILSVARERATVVGRSLTVSQEDVAGSGESALIAASRRAALVCVGAHGRGGVVAAILGSTARAVTASALCPIAVVPPRAEGGELTRRVVVGVDETSGSHDAVGYAFAQADLRQLRLTAVHSWHASDRVGFSVTGSPSAKWQLEIGNEEAAVAESLAGWCEKYPDVEVSRVSIRKPPAPAILAAAEDADLIVLGSRHPRPSPDLVGSPTVRRVLAGATCPVVVVPQLTTGD